MFSVNLMRAIAVSFFGVMSPNIIYCAWWDQTDNRARIFHADGLAKIEDYSFMVSIIMISPLDVPDKLICGGTILSQLVAENGIVITSGYCINNLIKNKVNQGAIRVRSNSEYWDCSCGITQERRVRNWNVHPNYREHTIPFVGTFLENDIGVIQIMGRFTGEYDSLNSLDPKPVGSVFDKASILGWGYTEASKSVSRRLRVANNFTLISENDCREKYYKDYFPARAFCLVDNVNPDGSRGPCAYDQGGPVFGDLHGGTYLLGIVSTSLGCGSSNTPAIVVNISKYYDLMHNLSWVVPSKNKTVLHRHPQEGNGFQWWKPVYGI